MCFSLVHPSVLCGRFRGPSKFHSASFDSRNRVHRRPLRRATSIALFTCFSQYFHSVTYQSASYSFLLVKDASNTWLGPREKNSLCCFWSSTKYICEFHHNYRTSITISTHTISFHTRTSLFAHAFCKSKIKHKPVRRIWATERVASCQPRLKYWARLSTGRVWGQTQTASRQLE